MNTMDTELIIIEVQNHPNLWNHAVEEYKDRDLKNKAWEEVTKKIVSTYDTMSKADQKKAVEKVQQRWKSARDAKIRSIALKKKLKSGSGRKNVKTYMYDQQLQFLESLTQPNMTESNFSPNQISGNSDNEEINYESNGEDDPLEDINVTSDRDPWARKRKSTSTPKNQKNNFEEDFLAAIRETSIEDEDRSFFESLLPTVRQFNTDQKLLFRSRILALTMEIKNGPGQTPNYPPMFQNSVNHNDPFYFSHQQQYSHFLPINSQIQQSSTSMPDTSCNLTYPSNS
ncbi:uncharacterized protein LOC111030681 [Myzus persicae]|uniref:uncharacterized protein LOC111030681 n=2 Tax=Myzus persicae TaxID=13164 RepID=UPI000B939F01|nr:uncharacterized protein LOC111030681 [Myzus persicae]